MSSTDYELIRTVGGDTDISIESLPAICAPHGSADSAVVFCEFEIGGANQVLGILYEEGYSKSNIYNGVWTYA